ncbi:MAG: prohibitin family protein [Bacteroidales bacterium]|nr:prohibitin family protein [Bacteroidales bacterium]
MASKLKNIFKETGGQLMLIKKGIVDYWERHTLGISMTLLVFIFMVALFWKNIFISLDSGQQGIRWSRFSGTKLDEYYGEGLQIIWPWDKMYIYNTRIQTKSDTMQILTSEGLSIKVEFIYRFYAVPDSIPVIHKNLGVNYAETFVAPEVESASMSIIGNYTPEQLYKISSLVIQSTIKYYLNKQLITRNIIVDDYLIKRITLPDIVSKSIEKKMVAEQLSYEFDYKLIVEEKEKKRKSIEAEGIRSFEAISQIPILKWKGLEVTSEFAKSENAKIVIMGTGEKSLPLLLNADEKK